MFFRKTLPLLIAVFLISVLIRTPNLNRPLSKHHEFCTAIALRVMQTWKEDGAAKHHFAPVMNYSNSRDKFINNHTTGLMDENGNYYYISHPPFAYLLPYAVFKFIHVEPDVLALQTFNLFFHFISAVLVYLIISLLLKADVSQSFCRSGLAGSMIYLFSPMTLWFHSNVYMSDMFVQHFWMAGVYVFLKMFYDKVFSPGWLLLLGLIVFLACFTEWLGYFFSFAAILLLLIGMKKDKGYRKIIPVVLFSCLLSLWFTVYLYSSIDGFENYFAAAIDRLRARTGALPGENIFTGVKIILINYVTGYFFVLFMLFSLLFLLRKRLSVILPGNAQLKTFVFLSLLPVALHHLVFFNYSRHDFAMLKTALFLSVAGGILWEELKKTNPASRTKSIILSACLLLSVLQYYYINRPGKYSLRGDEYAHDKKIGLFIKEYANPDEVVFVNHADFIQPQTVFYAKRNLKDADDVAHGKMLLKKYGQSKGIYFHIRDADTISYIRFSLSE